MIDLRSDTVTQPTAAMRRAMAEADVGDDCYGEDPTIVRLQELACEMLGTQAALFVPTGTMANQIGIKVLSRPGAEVICEQECHLVDHEAGACAMLSQVQLRGLPSSRGVFAADAVASAIRPADPYQPATACVAIENTHNTAGGTVWTIEEIEAVATVARDAGLPLFCDGARLFNAVVATGTSARSYAAPFDLVTISLYKGLGAPMGSLVCGRRDLIDEGWRFRRVFGGALRQGGVVAAAGIVALETMVDRLAADHAKARRLAEGIADVEPDSVELNRVQTNMVRVAVPDADAALRALRDEGVLAGELTPTMLRLVTHKDLTTEDIDRAIAVVGSRLRG